MRSATVTLGGVEYTITEARSRQASTWRATLKGQLGPLVDLILKSGQVQISSTEDLIGIVAKVAPTLLDAVETLQALVFSYSPTLGEIRERLLDEATDSEFIAAFWAVLGLAYPFGSILGKLSQLSGNGQVEPPTGPSSPVPSGASGTMS